MNTAETFLFRIWEIWKNFTIIALSLRFINLWKNIICVIYLNRIIDYFSEIILLKLIKNNLSAEGNLYISKFPTLLIFQPVHFDKLFSPITTPPIYSEDIRGHYEIHNGNRITGILKFKEAFQFVFQNTLTV